MTTRKTGDTPPRKRGTAASGARSTGKRPRATPAKRGGKGRKPGTPWPAATREEAVTLLREEGMAAAHDVTGVPKATLSKWAKTEGIELDEAARARTANAVEAVRERAARVKVDTVTLLEDHLGEAGSYLTAIVTANAAAAEAIAGLSDEQLVAIVDEETGEVRIAITDEGVARSKKLALALDGLPLAVRDAEGIVTRAIHDLQLLRGEATERGELVVEFGGIPRPNPRTVEVDQHAEPDAD